MPPKNHKKAASPFEARFDEAEKLQQKAERRRGMEAVPLYEQAALQYQEALQLSPPAERVADCCFALAETLQTWAEALLAGCASLPELTRAAEAEAQGEAERLLQRAVAHYGRVHESDAASGMRADAACNCGNTLASWAEVAAALRGPEAGVGLMGQAEECYVAALAKEEDATTYSNLADALTQHAELLCESGRGDAAAPLFARAIDSYGRACALSSSENGDDLPGLLCNWGAGLLAAAVQARDPALALPLLDEAARRLRESISFDRGDVAPHNALGDVCAARAEHAQRAGDAAGAAAALREALQAGYAAALRINAGDVAGTVGTAEVHASLAKLAAAGEAEAAAAHWQAAVAAYQAALNSKPAALGSFSERCSVRYNLACCLAGSGRVGEAARVVRGLVAIGGTTAAEVLADVDLASLQGLQL